MSRTPAPADTPADTDTDYESLPLVAWYQLHRGQVGMVSHRILKTGRLVSKKGRVAQVAVPLNMAVQEDGTPATQKEHFDGRFDHFETNWHVIDVPLTGKYGVTATSKKDLHSLPTVLDV